MGRVELAFESSEDFFTFLEGIARGRGSVEGTNGVSASAPQKTLAEEIEEARLLAKAAVERDKKKAEEVI